jgi:glyoxylase-like metal-dependent hydrolase (beta-lactamase superfamily II)
MTLDGTRTYIVGVRKPVVVDPGPPLVQHVESILRMLDGVIPIAIVLTHSHADHSGAASDLARATGSPVWMAPGARGGPHPTPHFDHAAAEGDLLETDAGRLKVVATPGHTPEHISLNWTETAGDAAGAVFVGDLMMGEGDTSLVAPPEGDLGDYLRSLTVIERLAPSVLYPAHGDALRDPADAVRRYRRHRMDRVEQVRAALETARPGDVESLIDQIYGRSLDPRLRSAAAGSLAAIIRYLENTSSDDAG